MLLKEQTLSFYMPSQYLNNIKLYFKEQAAAMAADKLC